jgi:hypothetical protein
VLTTSTLRVAANPAASSTTGCRRNVNCDRARARALCDVVPTDTLLNRIRGEFLEMPGLRLTCEQAQRLYGLDPALCQRALDRLVAAGFLCVMANRMYARIADVCDAPRSDSVPA